MADYKEKVDGGVVRASDQAHIPEDPRNKDWVDYQKWCADGGVPDPAEPEVRSRKRL